MIERNDNHAGRLKRRAFAFVVVASAMIPWQMSRAATLEDVQPTTAVEALNNALLSAMRSGRRASFAERYRQLAPTIQRVFDLNAVLAASIGLPWATLSDQQKAALVKAFLSYTVSSYVANFDTYNGQSFAVSPEARAAANGQVVVHTRLLRADGSPVVLDYVMRRGLSGWQVVDVLTDGSISRVAVQRSDFRELLRRGGVPALVTTLENKVASLSGGMVG